MLFPVLHTLVQLLLAVMPVAAAHPHHPKAIVIGGAGGKITVTYFTVPYNAKHLENVEDGFSWHLGFSKLTTAVELQAGNTTIPAGDYKLNAVYRADGWDLSLTNFELAQAEMRVQFGRGDKTEAKKKVAEIRTRLAESGNDKALPLTAAGFEAADDEHLTMTAIHRGFSTVQRMSDEPAGGVEFSLRVSFGDLHREVTFAEQFDSKR